MKSLNIIDKQLGRTIMNKKPTMTENIYGSKYWYLNGKLHREDGPAIEDADGHTWWYLNGKLHREDGPAIEFANGDKFWIVNDQYHREDGPAFICADGRKGWCLNGKELTEEEFNLKMNKITMIEDEYGKEWYLNGVLHREDGPAIEDTSGTKNGI